MVDILGATEGQNVYGERQQKLDIFADDVIFNLNRWCESHVPNNSMATRMLPLLEKKGALTKEKFRSRSLTLADEVTSSAGSTVFHGCTSGNNGWKVGFGCDIVSICIDGS